MNYRGKEELGDEVCTQNVLSWSVSINSLFQFKICQQLTVNHCTGGWEIWGAQLVLHMVGGATRGRKWESLI